MPWNQKEQDYSLYQKIRKLESIIKEEGEKEDLTTLRITYTQYRMGINPFYCQTSQGIILQHHNNPERYHAGETGPYIADTYYYDICNPWGYFRMFFSYTAFKSDEEIKAFLTNEMHDYYGKYDLVKNALMRINERVILRCHGKLIKNEDNQDQMHRTYALETIDNLPLPWPTFRKKLFYLSADFCEKRWDEMTKRYKSEKD